MRHLHDAEVIVRGYLARYSVIKRCLIRIKRSPFLTSTSVKDFLIDGARPWLMQLTLLFFELQQQQQQKSIQSMDVCILVISHRLIQQNKQ